jgi:hypothetical protein
MNNRDAQEGQKFKELIDALYELRGKPAPSRATAAIWYRALYQFDFRAIEKAVDSYCADQSQGYEMPQPKHLLAYLDKRPDRHGADEAWAIALRAADEDNTVVWTDEIAEAWAAAYPVWAEGDKIGARMAFRSAYDRIASDPSRKPAMTVSLGNDPCRRREALAQAVATGLIPASHPSVAALPAPVEGAGVIAILEGSTPQKSLPGPAQGDLEAARSKWAALKARLTGREQGQARDKAAERAEQKAAEDARRELLSQQVAGLMARGGM